MSILDTARTNFKNFINNDQLTPFVKYGVAPPSYMGTDPRFDKRPKSQETASSKQSSRMQPNPQAGEMLSGRVNPQTREQKFAQEAEVYTEAPNIAIYRKDPRTPEVDAESGKTDYQDDPKKADRSVRSTIGIGVSTPDSGDVRTPFVFGNRLAYQGSADQYSTSPQWLLGGSNYGPRPSQYHVPDQLEGHEHEGQPFVQPHLNAVTHTIGHDHPYDHRHKSHGTTQFATSRIVPGAPE